MTSRTSLTKQTNHQKPDNCLNNGRQELNAAANKDEAWERYRDVLSKIGRPIVRLMVPVSATLFLICALLKVACSDGSCAKAPQLFLPFEEKSDESFGSNSASAFLNALIAISLIVVVTFVLLLVIYLRLMFIIWIQMTLAMFMSLVVLTLTILKIVFARFELAVDWITMALLVWNIASTGLLSFMALQSPLMLKQIFLIYVSCLMGIIFNIGLPTFTTWILLAVLVIWDLVAVLTPCGPLRLLIELIDRRKKNNEKAAIPEMMIYSTMLYFMAKSELKGKDDNVKEQNSVSSLSESENSSSQRKPSRFYEIRPKLGLGDFIFYSVLVGKTVISNQLITTIYSSVAILFGLISTLILLIIFRRSLPALPISLTLALPIVLIMSLCGEDFSHRLAIKQIFI